MQLAVDAMHQYINQAVNIMLRGCRLDHMDLLFNRKLWFGFKNWRSATALTRGMVRFAHSSSRAQ